MTKQVLAALRIALTLTSAQRVMMACTELDGGNDKRTAHALVSRGLFGAATGGHITARYGQGCVIPGVRSRSALGALVARLLWGRFHSMPTVAAKLAAVWHAE